MEDKERMKNMENPFNVFRTFNFNDSITYKILAYRAFCFTDSQFAVLEDEVKSKVIKEKSEAENGIVSDSMFSSRIYLSLSNVSINKAKCSGVWKYYWAYAFFAGNHSESSIVYRSNDTLYFPIQHDSIDRVHFYESVVRKNLKFKDDKEEKLVKHCIIEGYFPNMRNLE